MIFLLLRNKFLVPVSIRMVVVFKWLYKIGFVGLDSLATSLASSSIGLLMILLVGLYGGVPPYPIELIFCIEPHF